MAVSDTQPTTLNMLNNLGFQFQISSIPNVNFFVTKCNLPGINTGYTRVGTPFATLSMPPDKIEFEDLQVTFKVSEDLSNWREIFNWLIALGFPKSSAQRAAYIQSSGLGDKLQSDGTLSILSSQKNPIISAKFTSLMPVSLTSINFDVSETDVTYVSATASFRYTLFELSNSAP